MWSHGAGRRRCRFFRRAGASRESGHRAAPTSRKATPNCALDLLPVKANSRTGRGGSVTRVVGGIVGAGAGDVLNKRVEGLPLE
jgi:hypothetical protein